MKNSTTKRRIKIGKTETVIEKINALNLKKRGCVACFLYKSHIYLSSKKAWLLDYESEPFTIFSRNVVDMAV